MILDTTGRSLQVLLEGAHTTTEPDFFASYSDNLTGHQPLAYSFASANGVTNGSTPVTVVGSPASGAQRFVNELIVFNGDTVPHTITVQLLDGATTRNLISVGIPAGQFLRYSPDDGFQAGTTTGPGTVTSVGLSLPAELTVSGSPVTASGTLSAVWANESANAVMAGPTSGGAATPGFRSLVASDIPSLSATYLPLAGGTMAGAIQSADGSAGSPSIYWGTNNGYFNDTTNVGIGIITGGAQIGTFLANGLQLLRSSATVQLSVIGDGQASQFDVRRFTADANSGAGIFRKGRGSFAVPALPASGDLLGQVQFNAYTGSGTTNTQVATFSAAVIEPTPSATALGTRFKWSLSPLGSAAISEFLRAEMGTGLSMYGANPVINQNRDPVLRSWTVGTLPANVTGVLEYVSNLNAGQGVVYGGSATQRDIATNQVASATVTGRGVLSLFTGFCNFRYRSIVENTMQQLSDAGLLSKLLGLWVHAVPTNSTDALLNWITPGTRNMTTSGSPTWAANQGFTGDGSSGLLLTSASATTFGAAQDSMAIGGYVRTASGSAATIIGNSNANTRRLYLGSAGSGALTSRLNDTTNDTFTPSKYTGMFVLSRTGSAGFNASVDDLAATTVTRASNALATGLVCFLGTADATGSEFSTAQLAFSFIATGLTVADIANLRAIMVDYYLVQVGAVTATVANLPPALNFQGQTYYVPDLGGGAGLLQSDSTNWFRTSDGYEVQSTSTGSQTLTSLTNGVFQNYTATLTGNVTVTLAGVDAKGTVVKKGARFHITRSGLGLFTFAIVNGGVGGGTLTTFASATAKAAICVFDGTNWQLMLDSNI